MTHATSFDGRRVLVTGASGFIGGALCCRLLATGAQVHAISRQSHPHEADGVRWWSGDLATSGVADRVVSEVKPDFTFHLASLVSGSRDLSVVTSTLQSNLVSTVNLMTALAEHGCQSVVLAGSMEEPLEGNNTPGSPYAAAKWASSGYARMFHALYALPVVTARIFMTYGPAQADRKKLIPYVTECLLRGEAPKLTSGDRLVDWVYVDDVVEGLVAAALTPEAAGQTIDLGSGRLVPIRSVVEELVQCVDSRITPEFGALPARPLEHSRVADIDASHRLTGWRPEVPLAEGLARTVAWYREHPEVEARTSRS